MRLNKIFTLIILFIALHSVILGSSFYLTSNFNINSDNDSLIKTTWEKFYIAILNKDFKTFKVMSTDCINCPWCVTNTKKEDTLFNSYRAANLKSWYDTLYSNLSYISIDKFMKEDYNFIFTKKTKSRMRKKYNLVFSDVEIYPRLYAKPCIIDTPDLNKLDPKEVLLVDTEAAPKRDGPQMAFVFIIVKGEYKFCGFSYLP